MTCGHLLSATGAAAHTPSLRGEKRLEAGPADDVRQLDRAAADRGRTSPDRTAADGLGMGHRPGRRILGHRSSHVSLVGGAAPPPADLRACPCGRAQRAGARIPDRGRRRGHGRAHRGAPVPGRTDRRGGHAVGGPATRALLADIGDRIGPGVAVRAVAWQDLAHRISMFVSPPVAALVVTRYGAMPLMWAESVAVLVAAVIVARVGTYGLGTRNGGVDPAPCAGGAPRPSPGR